MSPELQARAREIAAQAPPLTDEQRDLIARIFGRGSRPAADTGS
jgi:hypothetical protein